MPRSGSDGWADLPTPAGALVVALTAEQARSMDRSIPLLVSRVRWQLAGRPDHTDVVVELDLSAVPPTPIWAPLLYLITLLLRVTGRTSEIVVTGVAPGLAAGLVTDLPERVTVIDRSGRRWPY